MKKEQQNWIDQVMNSTEGMRRAQPPEGLLDKINDRIYGEETKIISLNQLRWIAAAVVLLLVLNVGAWSSLQSSQDISTNLNVDTEAALISDFNLYEL